MAITPTIDKQANTSEANNKQNAQKSVQNVLIDNVSSGVARIWCEEGHETKRK